MILVQTENSTYEIDCEAHTVVRKPRLGALRRDGEALPVLAIEEVAVGKPLVMLLSIRADGVPTVRTTSPVVMVRRWS